VKRVPEGSPGRLAAITELGRRVRTEVAAVVPRGTRVALLDFPEYGNVGDSLIWLGQLAALRAAGASVGYAAGVSTYDPQALRRSVSPGSGVVLLSGGGNFGDLWPVHGELRNRVLSELTDFPVVQLPQSIHFSDIRNLETARSLIRAHPAFTLMIRDEASRATAEERLEHPVVLCPDVAFALGPMARAGEPQIPIVLLSRDDKEGPSDSGRPADEPPRVDWVDEPAPSLVDRLAERWKRAGGPISLPARIRLFRHRAEHRVRHGARLLSRGQAVVTNRLHGMILSMLMGIPHFVSDTRQGKIGAFHGTWLATSMPGVMCGSERDALRRARELTAAGSGDPVHAAR